MNRDKDIISRAMRLLELNNRRYRMDRISFEQRGQRAARISRSHYRAQHAAGATDYPSKL